MKEDRRRIPRAGGVDREAHRIEDAIGRKEITVNLAFPELTELRAVKSPAIPDFESQLFAANASEIYCVIMLGV